MDTFIQSVVDKSTSEKTISRSFSLLTELLNQTEVCSDFLRHFKTMGSRGGLAIEG